MAFWEDGIESNSSFDPERNSPRGPESPACSGSPGPLQPLGGSGPEPDLADFGPSTRKILLANRAGNERSIPPIVPSPRCQGPQPRTKARAHDVDFALDDIGEEEYRVPAVSSTIPGLRPAREQCGASIRRQDSPSCGVTGRRARDAGLYDGAQAPGDSYAYLSEEEMPAKMPKLPFASQLLADVHSSPRLPGDGGYSRWLDRGPQAGLPPGAAEAAAARVVIPEFLTGVLDARQDPRIPPASSRVDAYEDDDEDSWAAELLADSPRNLLCNGACRLVSLEGLTAGLPPGASEAAAVGAGPADDAMNGLNDFVRSADDSVLSYILDQAVQEKANRAPQVQVKRRLQPGMPLPGQRPGFPLQL